MVNLTTGKIVIILVGLFSMQHFGTDIVGWLCALVVLLWFRHSELSFIAELIKFADFASKSSFRRQILLSPLENLSHENYSKSSPEPAGEINLCIPHPSQINTNDVHEGKETLTNEMIDKKNAIKFTDIHLSIQMPSGSSLQANFIASDRLRSVKIYVDDNNRSMAGSYDLAIPYPRKVFGEEVMNKKLAELGFAGRQAVIVIQKKASLSILVAESCSE